MKAASFTPFSPLRRISKCPLAIAILMALACPLTLLADGTTTQHHEDVVFAAFPDDSRLFRPDVLEAKESIIQKHGREEWEIVVLTSEFHTHLGIYSILGAKMGLRAREHFKVGIDQLIVTSYAGNKPPISCLSDGLQVSTGATLGHGTISLALDPPAEPKAQFTCAGKTLRLQLKEKYWQQIRRDIAGIIEQHGLASDKYWLAVRQLGITYWRDWSRNEIFELAVVN